MIRNGTLDDCMAVYSLVCEMENRALPFDRFSEIFQSQMEDPNYQSTVYSAPQSQDQFFSGLSYPLSPGVSRNDVS